VRQKFPGLRNTTFDLQLETPRSFGLWAFFRTVMSSLNRNEVVN
jgi:hypothetical protein